ncbi:hypothetical protein YenMTG1_185 [Yersinia phage vB_YenM_TG1]|uniref:Uncharacterized protein n=1 Tax=Yersinia phage vB_YenM_TG1 TaxID=1589265 RepID=A0A0B5A2V3_9CAUD|nr:hypothetical protein AVV33_gp210 [Yersinia phage vB_YenM_TG1]AJD81995.1 hypothetical protein YenMTG1_185 [Yersinia phage vB_YenM_TG1]
MYASEAELISAAKVVERIYSIDMSEFKTDSELYMIYMREILHSFNYTIGKALLIKWIDNLE